MKQWTLIERCTREKCRKEIATIDTDNWKEIEISETPALCEDCEKELENIRCKHKLEEERFWQS